MSEEYEEESSGNEDNTNFVAHSRQQKTYDSSDYEANLEEASPSDDGYGVYNGNGMPAASSRRKLGKNNVAIGEYEEQWVEEEEEEEEEQDNGGDDPHDADFEPGSPQASVSQQEEDDDEYNDSVGEEEYEDEENGGFLVDSEDEFGYERPANHRKRQTTRIRLPLPDNKRRRVSRKREDFTSEMDYSDSEEEDVPRRAPPGPRIIVNTEAPMPSRMFGRPVASSNGTRSRRSIPKKSYIEEADEDEEDDDEEEAAKKAAKMLEEVEEDELDRIERVLWHQPKGLAAAAIEDGRIPVPYVINTDPCAEIDWDEQEFYIKMKGQSHLHCQWHCLTVLTQLAGYKKVQNYMKRAEEDRLRRRALVLDAAEIHDVNKEMELDFLKQCVQVERVFSDRVTNVDGEEYQEYLVKWKGLPYAESSWERDVDLHFAQGFIDEYKEREANSYVTGKPAEVQRRNLSRKVETQPEWLRGGELRDYQLEGLNFLLNCWRKNVNLILADEMGLGKTVQSVSMLGYLQNALEVVGPFLVIVPLSTITNWAKEFRKWLPNMNVVIYVGDRASRQLIRKYEFDTNVKGRPMKFNTLVTTYEVILKDKDVLSHIRWDYMMVDEAHRLKNSVAALYSALMEFNAKNKVLVTGTPLQNSVEELWSLLHFLEPQKFRVKADFVERYKSLTGSLDKPKRGSSNNDPEPDRTALLERLHAELAPHMLRRVIKDVEKSLPPKIERILRVEMTPLQKQYYKWILERNFTNLNRGVRGKQVSLLNIVVELKKCCNHPFLFESADVDYNAPNVNHIADKVDRIALSSGKLVLLDKLLVRLRDTGHRVLIFSQMVKMLDILAEYLALKGFQFQRLDGSTKHDIRQQAMEHFNAPGSEDFCFLLSTRAGGLGINLATADTVIIFDSDWNPQNDLQAMSRAHRIGQKDTVNVYRFVTSKSVEEDILERAKRKMVLDHLVIQKLNKKEKKEKKDQPGGMFDQNDLAAILRFGAEELFKETQEEAENKLKNMNIDEILERAEHVTGDDSQDGNELLGAFKVANFSQSSDDIAFWSRLLPQPDKNEDGSEQGPRRSRNVKTFSEDSGYGRRRGTQEKGRRRPIRTEPQAPRVDGAAAQVFTWEGGRLSKRDASAFVKGVKRFGDKSRMEKIVADIPKIGDASKDDLGQLYDSLIDGCTEAVETAYSPKGAILDFFGVSVRAQELLARVKELTLLGKRIKRHKDPVAQFRLRSHPRVPSWSKSSGWNQVDDARLLLGVHYHGVGNWEKIREDSSLCLTKKMPLDSIPKASHLEARVNQLLRKELELDNDPKARKKRGGDDDDEGPSKARAKERAKPTGTRKSARNLNREAAAAAAASMKEESEEDDKEEGEISGSDNEVKDKEVKKKIEEKEREQRWHVWCGTALEHDLDTLNRLKSLSASKEPNKEVVKRVKMYLKKLGSKIDSVLVANQNEKCSLEKMEIRLWNYVAGFSDLPGSQLSELYRKLKADAAAEDNNAPVSTSKGKEEAQEPATYKRRRGRNADEAESWKRRRRQDD